MNISGLPRLLYIGDVPVEASYHGSALLFRLLAEYTDSQLTILESGISTSQPDRRIPDVTYKTSRQLFSWLQSTRFSQWYTSGNLLAAAIRARLLERTARAAHPEALLTVTHGSSWISAALLAEHLEIPLHLICHDEWARTRGMQNWKERVFARHYRQAASRLCVSPFMAEEYQRRYGVEAKVMYPSRASDVVIHRKPPPRLLRQSKKFTCVFAGTINTLGVTKALQTLAACLGKYNGRLVIYGPITVEAASTSGLSAPNIEIAGLFPHNELMAKLRVDADVLYVPMSFAEADRNNMEISFPSKLADYTTVGIPLLIQGPTYCSAVRWAIENNGVAEVVTDNNVASLTKALGRLKFNPEFRFALAQCAIEIGMKYFSQQVATTTFFTSLLKSNENSL